MTKTFCDVCETNITSCVNILEVSTKYMASIQNNTTLELCNPCYKALGWTSDSNGPKYHSNFIELIKTHAKNNKT